MESSFHNYQQWQGNAISRKQTTKNNLEIRLQLSSCELSVFSAEPINEIEIFSSNGCLIQRNQGENLQTTNVPQLPAGIYLVKVKSEEGYTVTKKILLRIYYVF